MSPKNTVVDLLMSVFHKKKERKNTSVDGLGVGHYTEVTRGIIYH